MGLCAFASSSLMDLHIADGDVEHRLGDQRHGAGVLDRTHLHLNTPGLTLSHTVKSRAASKENQIFYRKVCPDSVLHLVTITNVHTDLFELKDSSSADVLS